MATVGNKKRPPAKVSVPRSNVYPPSVPVGMVPVRKATGEDLMGWIAACVLIALLLPMGAMLYLDILEAKHEVKSQVEKVEKLRREIERNKRDKEPNTISDNPVFDRVRRFDEIPMSKSVKLGKTRM